MLSSYSFDLNYVGCELRRGGGLHFVVGEFDLNYVGCEPNKFPILKKFIRMFDLNYVGCELYPLGGCFHLPFRLI